MMRAVLLIVCALAFVDAAHVIRDKEEAHFVLKEAVKKRGEHGNDVRHLRDVFGEKKRVREERQNAELVEKKVAEEARRALLNEPAPEEVEEPRLTGNRARAELARKRRPKKFKYRKHA